MRADALVRFPELRGALERLGGALDAARPCSASTPRVEQDALAPREVARAALAEMGLIEPGDDLEIDEPVRVAHSPLVATDAETGAALRAVRQAFPGRRVLLEPLPDPLDALGEGEAPIALVAAVELADLDEAGTPMARPFEGLGVVGQTYLHLVSLSRWGGRWAKGHGSPRGPWARPPSERARCSPPAARSRWRSCRSPARTSPPRPPRAAPTPPS